MLVATDLTVQYPSAPAPAVVGVSLTVAPGEVVVVAGPNGSGKSTLQRALLGLAPRGSGTVTLDGVALETIPRPQVATRVGALPQREEPAFSLRVEEAVLLGRWARLAPLAAVTPDDRRAATLAIQRCDLTHLAGRPIETLSGGEWQRVRLARALAAQPAYLLLDEPTAALDIAHEMEVFALLRDLAANGLGILVITHQLGLAARMADRALLLDRGCPVAAGRPEDVFTAANLTRVFRWPITVQVSGDGTPLIIPAAEADPSVVGGPFVQSPSTKALSCP